MKSALASLLAAFTLIGIASAEEIEVQKKIICVDHQTLTDTIGADSEYREVATWGGNSLNKQTRFILAINSKTGTWTFVQYDNDMACILGNGSESLFFGESTAKNTQ